MADFSRLSENWAEWAPASGLREAFVSTECDDCLVRFASRDASFHLRREGDWWLVDTIDDRGQRHDDDAKFSTFLLAEKYLIWNWVTAAKLSLATGRLGAELYRQGYAVGVEIAQLDGSHVELRLEGDIAVLISGTATTFSHIMLMSVDEIERAARSAR